MGNNITSTHNSPPSTGKVILSDGTVFEYKSPLTVAELMLEYPQQVVVEYKSTSNGKRPSPLPADEELDTNKLYVMLPVKKGKPASLVSLESRQLLFTANNVLKSSKFFSKTSGVLPFFVKICPAPGNWVAEKNGVVVKKKEESEENELPEKEDYFGKILEETPELLSRQVSCKGWKPSLDTIVEKGINLKKVHEEQSQRVAKRKYPHRLSRKGYISLKEEEVKLGKLEAGEDPDRAILWKKARVPKKGEIPEDLLKVTQKIDTLLEKEKGEFLPYGAHDVLTAALETPEHSGRVRTVGGFISPKAFFNLPMAKSNRITKAELLARDKKRSEELERATAEMKLEIEELKALVSTAEARLNSPLLSDKGSFYPEKEQVVEEAKVKSATVKELNVDDECMVIKQPTPPSGKQVPRKCDLSVGKIEDKVAFGFVIPCQGESSKIHGREMSGGCLRVSVDGFSKPDALLPVPVPGELETFIQALGSHVAWPEELISYPGDAIPKKNTLPNKKNPDDLQKLKTLFSGAKPSVKVPKAFRLLYKHATSYMQTTGSSIQIPCDFEVFGHEKTIFLLHENVLVLLEFEMVGQALITTAYMLHLHSELNKTKDIEKFAFCDPGFTFKLNSDFESYVVNQLSQGDADHIFILPHNHNMHWILTIIWEGQIYILNPLSHPARFPALEKALSGAVSSFNIKIGKSGHVPKVKNLAGSPKQPGGHECGYVVMRYMKDITEDEGFSFVEKWSQKSRMSYEMTDLDEVRCELLEFIQSHV